MAKKKNPRYVYDPFVLDLNSHEANCLHEACIEYENMAYPHIKSFQNQNMSNLYFLIYVASNIIMLEIDKHPVNKPYIKIKLDSNTAYVLYGLLQNATNKHAAKLQNLLSKLDQQVKNRIYPFPHCFTKTLEQ